MAYFNRKGEYYEGDRISGRDVEVPRRPSGSMRWNGKEWLNLPNRAKVHRLMTDDEISPDGLRIWGHMKLHAPNTSTDLFTALTGSGDEAVLLLNIQNLLLMVLETLEQLGKPFSDAQVERLDEILAEANFDWQLSDLNTVEE